MFRASGGEKRGRGRREPAATLGSEGRINLNARRRLTVRRDGAGSAAWRDARRETGVDDRRTSGVHEFFTILSVSSSDLIILLVPLGSFPRRGEEWDVGGTRARS